jgi:hypothetical protein
MTKSLLEDNKKAEEEKKTKGKKGGQPVYSVQRSL